MTDAPRARFNIKKSGYTVWDLNDIGIINPNKFLSKGRSTPFDGWKIYGKCLLTVLNGKIVYKDCSLKSETGR